MQIIMHPDEVTLLKSFLCHCDNYFEFGMGGSTYLAANTVRKRISAVDTSEEWVSNVKTEIGDTHSDKIIDLKHINVGPIGLWGTPTSSEFEHLFPAYSHAIVDTGFNQFDFCLVDGRFRVACFLQALLFLRRDAVLAVHDYAIRPHYHLIEQFARPIATCQSLTMFVRRTESQDKDISDVLQKYLTVSD